MKYNIFSIFSALNFCILFNIFDSSLALTCFPRTNECPTKYGGSITEACSSQCSGDGECWGSSGSQFPVQISFTVGDISEPAASVYLTVSTYVFGWLYYELVSYQNLCTWGPTPLNCPLSAYENSTFSGSFPVPAFTPSGSYDISIKVFFNDNDFPQGCSTLKNFQVPS